VKVFRYKYGCSIKLQTNDLQVILISDGWFALMLERAMGLVRGVTATACDLGE
jgi:hypothetical protein